ncbi:hypothetical protein C0J52_18851 [Blattella germanica]|nr:hypothetical protein C0J52_18851 [Blattella germanica]
MELKEEIDEYVEQKVTYVDAIEKEGDDKKPLFTFVDVGITQTKDEVCQIKEERVEIIEMQPKDEDLSIDVKPAVEPFFNWLKIEHHDNTLGDPSSLISGIEKQNSSQSVNLVKQEEEENQESLSEMTGATKYVISNSLIEESNSLSQDDDNSSDPNIGTTNLVARTQVKKETEDNFETELEETSTDDKFLRCPMLELLPVSKIECPDSTFVDARILLKNNEEDNTSLTMTQIKEEDDDDENEESLRLITEATNAEISSNPIEKRELLSKITINSHFSSNTCPHVNPETFLESTDMSGMGVFVIPNMAVPGVDNCVLSEPTFVGEEYPLWKMGLFHTTV